MKTNRKFTREELYSNIQAYNKYLTLDYLTGCSWRQLLCFCHPTLREEINGIGYNIF